MSASATKEMLFFLHIQKTAGTSVKQFLQSKFAEGEICPYPTWSRLSRISPLEFRNYRFLYGQHPIWLKELMPENARFATVLRHPLDRTLSHFNYLKSELFPIADQIHPNNAAEYYFAQEVFQKKKTFVELIEDPTYLSYYVVNYQTRFLSRHWTEELSFQSPEFSLFEIQRSCQREAFDIAMDNLSRIDFVGTVENLELFFLHMCHEFGWFFPKQTPKYNVSSELALQKEQLPNETRERIEQVTRLDLELYQNANRLLRERTEHLALSIEKINRPYNDVLGRLPKREAILLNFDEPFFGEGWHQREWGPDGLPLRWTGPGTTTYLDLPISNDKDLLLAFRIIKTFDREQFSLLKVIANGIELKLETLYEEPINFGGSYFAKVPKAVLNRNQAYCRIEFQTSKTFTPNSLDNTNPDNRALGLCFGWIHLGPRLL